jgi:hypothetical protein
MEYIMIIEVITHMYSAMYTGNYSKGVVAEGS